MTVKLDLTLGELPRLHGKPRRLTQFMVTLIVNASHAIGDRPNGRITVTTTHEDGSAFVIISDNGCGMTSDVMKKVFEPFFTTKEVGRGTATPSSSTRSPTPAPPSPSASLSP